MDGCTVLGLCDGTVQVGQWGWLLYSVGTMSLNRPGGSMGVVVVQCWDYVMELSWSVSGGCCCTVLVLCDGTVKMGQWGWLLYSVGTM